MVPWEHLFTKYMYTNIDLLEGCISKYTQSWISICTYKFPKLEFIVFRFLNTFHFKYENKTKLFTKWAFKLGLFYAQAQHEIYK